MVVGHGPVLGRLRPALDYLGSRWNHLRNRVGAEMISDFNIGADWTRHLVPGTVEPVVGQSKLKQGQ